MLDKNAKIYIPGHTGLVGSAILRHLKDKGYTNFILYSIDELDLKRQDAVERLFENDKPEYVILAAAKVGGIVANSTYKAEFIYDNIMIAANIINSSYKFGVKKLLNLGSSCIYPKFAEQPLKEEFLLTGALEQTNEAYAIAKIAAIKLCRYYNEQYGTDFVSVMPTNLYGANDNYNLETSHVLPALIRKMILAKYIYENDEKAFINDVNKISIGFGINYNIESLTDIIQALKTIGIEKDFVKIWGSGNAFREFLHVDDMAEASIYVLENLSYKDIGEFINIGTGNDITIKDLAYLVKEIVGFKGKLEFDTTKPEGTPKKQLDVSRLKKLGWSPKVTLSDGIKKVVDNYYSQF